MPNTSDEWTLMDVSLHTNHL